MDRSASFLVYNNLALFYFYLYFHFFISYVYVFLWSFNCIEPGNLRDHQIKFVL